MATAPTRPFEPASPDSGASAPRRSPDTCRSVLLAAASNEKRTVSARPPEPRSRTHPAGSHTARRDAPPAARGIRKQRRVTRPSASSNAGSWLRRPRPPWRRTPARCVRITRNAPRCSRLRYSRHSGRATDLPLAPASRRPWLVRSTAVAAQRGRKTDTFRALTDGGIGGWDETADRRR